MKSAGVTKYIGMGSGPMLMPGERPGGFQRTLHTLLRLELYSDRIMRRDPS
jgi:hypothetical protein